jgi:hypothetical protein
LIFLLVLAVIWAIVGYRLSEADKRNLGRTPWGLPSELWALFWFLSLIVGLILYLVAHRAEVRRGHRMPMGALDANGQLRPPPVPRRSVASDFPAYPRPADGGESSPQPPPMPGPPLGAQAPDAPHPPDVPQAAPPPAAAPSEISPPAWQPDPSGRFHYRWWTGTEWTSYVSTNGQVVVDTSPDQRIGPY